MCERYFTCMCVRVSHACSVQGGRRWQRIPRYWNQQMFANYHWVLGIEPRSSRTAASVPNCWAVFPSLYPLPILTESFSFGQKRVQHWRKKILSISEKILGVRCRTRTSHYESHYCMICLFRRDRSQYVYHTVKDSGALTVGMHLTARQDCLGAEPSSSLSS